MSTAQTQGEEHTGNDIGTTDRNTESAESASTTMATTAKMPTPASEPATASTENVSASPLISTRNRVSKPLPQETKGSSRSTKTTTKSNARRKMAGRGPGRPPGSLNRATIARMKAEQEAIDLFKKLNPDMPTFSLKKYMNESETSESNHIQQVNEAETKTEESAVALNPDSKENAHYASSSNHNSGTNRTTESRLAEHPIEPQNFRTHNISGQYPSQQQQQSQHQPQLTLAPPLQQDTQRDHKQGKQQGLQQPQNTTQYHYQYNCQPTSVYRTDQFITPPAAIKYVSSYSDSQLATYSNTASPTTQQMPQFQANVSSGSTHATGVPTLNAIYSVSRNSVTGQTGLNNYSSYNNPISRHPSIGYYTPIHPPTVNSNDGNGNNNNDMQNTLSTNEKVGSSENYFTGNYGSSYNNNYNNGYQNNYNTNYNPNYSHNYNSNYTNTYGTSYSNAYGSTVTMSNDSLPKQHISQNPTTIPEQHRTYTAVIDHGDKDTVEKQNLEVTGTTAITNNANSRKNSTVPNQNWAPAYPVLQFPQGYYQSLSSQQLPAGPTSNLPPGQVQQIPQQSMISSSTAPNSGVLGPTPMMNVYTPTISQMSSFPPGTKTQKVQDQSTTYYMHPQPAAQVQSPPQRKPPHQTLSQIPSSSSSFSAASSSQPQQPPQPPQPPFLTPQQQPSNHSRTSISGSYQPGSDMYNFALARENSFTRFGWHAKVQSISSVDGASNMTANNNLNANNNVNNANSASINTAATVNNEVVNTYPDRKPWR